LPRSDSSSFIVTATAALAGKRNLVLGSQQLFSGVSNFEQSRLRRGEIIDCLGSNEG
jgi:hypothetical protein